MAFDSFKFKTRIHFMRKTLKLFSFAIFFLFSFQNANSLDSIMHGQHNIRISKTKFFDLIYPKQSEKSAQILFEKADDLYLELKNTLNMRHDFRIPVVISPAQDEFNAYQSCAPFTHIVIFDTPAPAEQSYFSEELLNTFRHELIHAITYSLKNKFFSNFSKIFGDTWNPALITVTTGMAEGATVSIESQHGEGRMNNGFHLNLVRQAKIEGKFPKFSEIQGAKDIYPGTSESYYFGGAFSEFLQNKYGMEKYASFWYRCVNFRSLTYFGAFKKTYGISIKEAWQDFYDSIPVEDNLAVNQKDSSSTKTNDSIPLNILKKQKAGKSIALASNGKSIVFYHDSDVKISTGPKYEKSKKLFSLPNVKSLSLSADGRFIGASWISQQYHPTSKALIYDTQSKKSFTLKEKSIREINIFKANNKYFAVAVKTHSQQSSLVVYELNFSGKNDTKKSLKSVNLIYSANSKFGDSIYSPCGSNNGSIFFILKEGLQFSISYYNIFTKESKKYSLPKNHFVQSLNIINFPLNELDDIQKSISLIEKNAEDYSHKNLLQNSTNLCFNYATTDHTSRLGIIQINESSENNFSNDLPTNSENISASKLQNEKTLQNKKLVQPAKILLSQKDLSGGIFSPVFAGSNKIAYLAKFYEGNKILLQDFKLMENSKIIFPSQSSLNLSTCDSKTKQINSDQTLPSDKFNLPLYMLKKKGTIVPFSFVNTYASDVHAEIKSLLLPIGITYITSTPWTMPIIGTSCGYNYATNSAGASVFCKGGSYQTNFFNYTAIGSVEFDSQGFKQTFANISFQNVIPMKGLWNFVFSEDLKILYGRQTDFDGKDLFDNFKEPLDINIFTEKNRVSIGFKNIRTNEIKPLSCKGISISSFYDQKIIKQTDSPSLKINKYQNIGLDLQFYSDIIRPISLQAELFPTESYIAAALTKIIFFDTEIQKSTNFFPIFYFNRVSLSACYIAKFAPDNYEPLDSWAIIKTPNYIKKLIMGDFKYNDEISLTASLYVTPNIGGLARPAFKFSWNTQISYKFFHEPNKKPLSISFFANLSSLKF